MRIEIFTKRLNVINDEIDEYDEGDEGDKSDKMSQSYVILNYGVAIYHLSRNTFFDRDIEPKIFPESQMRDCVDARNR